MPFNPAINPARLRQIMAMEPGLKDRFPGMVHGPQEIPQSPHPGMIHGPQEFPERSRAFIDPPMPQDREQEGVPINEQPAGPIHGPREESEQATAYTSSLDKERNIQWQPNKEGGQQIGNKQKVRKPTNEDFKQHILPRLQKGIFGDGTTEQQYENMLKQYPDIVISFIDKGQGWQVSAVDKYDNIKANIDAGIKQGWAKEEESSSRVKAIKERLRDRSRGYGPY